MVETVFKTLCPYCGSKVTDTLQMCCGECHCEEIEVCAYCEEPDCDNECQEAKHEKDE